jgi:hypothetical protein
MASAVDGLNAEAFPMAGTWPACGSGVPNRIRQLGQLPSSKPDLGKPHTEHVSDWLVMTIRLFFSKSGGILQEDSNRVLILIFLILILLSPRKIKSKIKITINSRCSSPAQRTNQEPHFIINFLRGAHRLRDFMAE